MHQVSSPSITAKKQKQQKCTKFSAFRLLQKSRSGKNAPSFQPFDYCKKAETAEMHQVSSSPITAKKQKQQKCTKFCTCRLLQKSRNSKNAPSSLLTAICKRAKTEKMHQVSSPSITAKEQNKQKCTKNAAVILTSVIYSFKCDGVYGHS